MIVHYSNKGKYYILPGVKEFYKSSLLPDKENGYDFKLQDNAFLTIANCEILKVEY